MHYILVPGILSALGLFLENIYNMSPWIFA